MTAKEGNKVVWGAKEAKQVVQCGNAREANKVMGGGGGAKEANKVVWQCQKNKGS